MSVILSKKQFLINCSVYYLNFSVSSKPWFYTLLFVICYYCYLFHDFTATTTSWHWI